VTLGEGLFLDVCADSDPAAHIRSLADHSLAKLNDYLEGRREERGVIGEVWAMVIAEAARRFFKGGVR